MTSGSARWVRPWKRTGESACRTAIPPSATAPTSTPVISARCRYPTPTPRRSTRTPSPHTYRVPAQVRGRQVRAGPDSQYPAQHGGGVPPAVHGPAGGQSGRHPARGDGARDGTEEERCEDRGQRERTAEEPLLPQFDAGLAE